MSKNKKSDWEDPLKALTTAVDTIKGDIGDINAKILDIEASLQNITSISETVDAAKIQVNGIDTAVSDLKRKYDHLSAQYDQLQERLIYMECQSRRDNLILNGVPENSKLNCIDAVYDVIEKNLGLPNAKNIKIVRCHRLGPPPKPAKQTGASSKLGFQPRPRGIIFKLHWFGDRQTIWKARANLKNSGYFLSEDYPKEIIERRKVLLPILRVATNKGYNAYLLVDKLHIDIEIKNEKKHLVIDHNSLRDLPEDIDPEYATTRSTDTTMVFFNKLCPLSNFYEAPFTFEGKLYDTVERCYQLARANKAGDQVLAQRIADAKTPAECKRYGDMVRFPNRSFRQWDQQKEQIMRAVLVQKFSQNDNVRQYLLNTKNLHLGEASPTDKFWGTGAGLNSQTATDQNAWVGNNKLGQLLMQLRDEFKT
jgi:ribA/ribD-fused uncharacterized protein